MYEIKTKENGNRVVSRKTGEKIYFNSKAFDGYCSREMIRDQEDCMTAYMEGKYKNKAISEGKIYGITIKSDTMEISAESWDKCYRAAYEDMIAPKRAPRTEEKDDNPEIEKWEKKKAAACRQRQSFDRARGKDARAEEMVEYWNDKMIECDRAIEAIKSPKSDQVRKYRQVAQMSGTASNDRVRMMFG